MDIILFCNLYKLMRTEFSIKATVISLSSLFNIETGINYFILLFTLLLSVSSVFSQTGNNFVQRSPNYFFRQFTVDDGLSQNIISSIHQDHPGFLWIANKDGLNMFDLYNFRVIKYDPSSEYSFSDNYINAICEDPAHRRWIGSFSGGLHHFDRRTERFYHFSRDHENENSILGNRIQGNIIFGPWLQQTWVFIGYLVIILLIILSFRKYEISQIRLRNRIRIANIETEKLKELDHLKSRFFANISHEFRTPLTLIKGPLEQLIEEATDQQRKRRMEMILVNVSRLLQLVNQILDLSKIESGSYSIKVSNGDVIGLLKGVTMAFASAADQKNINLSIEECPYIDYNGLKNCFYYDSDILEKIINNLLSNALKFTPNNGRVTVKYCIVNDNERGECLEIIVEDSGIGIAADKLPYIYDRFYQIDTSSKSENEGSGIGLAYIKELLSIHKGGIHVRSIPGSGTTFSLRFPVGKDHFPDGQIIHSISEQYQAQYHPEFFLHENYASDGERETTANPLAPLVLIVDDHVEVSHFIAESIQNDYRVKEASNVYDGFKIAEDIIPELIISDIMMPGIDGYEFCELIRSSDKTSHIPVIMLTARADYADKIMGLQVGADDYLVKPFNVKELKIRVKNLIDSRRALRERFSSNSIIKPGEISVTSRDKSFMEKLLKVVEHNIGNCKFSIEDLGREVGMSQSQIHRKLKATVNMPANHFIRSVRMNRAMHLLQKEGGNISEIAYMVGYDDPGYFTKTFRTFFGKLPSEIKKV